MEDYKEILRDYSLIGVESEKTTEMGLADVEWCQSPIPRDKMRELLVLKNGPAVKNTLLWFGLIFGSGYLVFLWWGSWFVVFPYIVYSVLYASTSDSRWHESSHGTAFKTDWMNNLLYEISSFMVFRQSTVWRWSHARHHSDTIIRGRDPEIAVPRPPQFRKIFLAFFGVNLSLPEMKRLLSHASGRIDPEEATYVPESEYKKVFFKARLYISLFATDGICTHGNAHLGEGIVIGGQIECPKHNGHFSLRDGMPKRAPVCVGIKTYKAFRNNGSVYLELEPENGDTQAKELDFIVAGNRNVTAFIKELVLEPKNGESYDFSPGQYIQLIIPPHEIKFDRFHIDSPFRPTWESIGLFEHYAKNLLYLKRNYSMATNPASEEQLKFNVRITLPPDGEVVPAGAGSSYVFSLKPGDEVKLAGPYGDFTIKPMQKEMVYLGGGAGMTPLRSHLAYLFETEGTKRKVSYWYGARTKADLYYLEFFESLQHEHKNFTFHVVLSEARVGEDWEGFTGFIHQVLYSKYLKDHPNPNNVEYYLCGPPAMIKAGMEMVESLGVSQDQIAWDEF